jgi:hypothetical protein
MIKETKEGLRILIGENDQEFLFVDTARLIDCIDYLYKNNLRFIIINSYQGYEGKDISFLTGLSDFLEGVSVLDSHFDYSVINNLHKLRYLGIPDNGKDVIDLANFPDLEICGFSYSKRLINLEKCKKLNSLTLSKYKSKSNDLLALPLLEKLSHLNLIQPEIKNLIGIERFSSLRKLEIFSALKLEYIAALRGLSEELEELSIEGSKKIVDFEIIGQIINLRKIILADTGEIKSLEFLIKLPKLHFISFWGTNVVDGNIKFCEGIEYVGFDKKNHYTHSPEDFR